MNQPTECKHCGLHATWHIHEDTFFACGTIYAGRGDYWNQSTGCVEIMQSREKIKRAIEVLEGATRFELVKDDYGAYMKGRDSWGNWLDVIEVEQAIEILRGNSPESPDSSPVIADQLAVADYYEAVRQQVPWMVTIEHIEGLIEGYRQCGLMVWRAAEQIKLIFGGGNGQAD